MRFDWELSLAERLVAVVIWSQYRLANSSYCICYCSSRDGSCRRNRKRGGRAAVFLLWQKLTTNVL